MAFDALLGGKPVYRGGEKVGKPVEILITNPNWDTCRFRSDVEQEYFVQTCSCGSGENRKGFFCSRLEINGLKPDHCKECVVYQKKNEIQDNKNQD